MTGTTEQMGATQALARRVAQTRYEDIPQAAREVAKQALMDFIGVTVAGAREPLTELLVAEALDEGGHSQAQLIGRSERLSARQAALINGAAGHAHDYDDVHMAMNGHPTVPVAPAVLAQAERMQSNGRRTGRDLITALCTGIDAECIIGRYAGGGHYGAGWHATGTLGSFGATAAVASLTDLDQDTTAAALGIAGTQAAGLKSQFGTMCKPLHAGHAAATGLESASLAGRGFTSRDNILETAQGFMATQATTADLDRFDEAIEVPGYAQDVCFKYHAACYLTHASIEASRNLSARNAFDPNDIVDIEIQVDPGHFKVCNIQEPSTGLEAKFSLRFTAAMALTGMDTASIDLFTDELTQDPDLVRFRDLVTVVERTDRSQESIVTIRTADGGEHRDSVDVSIPQRDLELQWQKLTHKFDTLTTPVLGADRARELARLCRHLEAESDLGNFFALLAAPADGAAS